MNETYADESSQNINCHNRFRQDESTQVSEKTSRESLNQKHLSRGAEGWRRRRLGSGVISASDSLHGPALPLMTPDPLRWKWQSGHQAGKTLGMVLGDRYRSRARRQGDGSLWRRWLHVWSAMDANDSRPRWARLGLTGKVTARTMVTGSG